MKKQTRGGARANAGRKKLPEQEKKKPYTVQLYEKDRDYLIEEYSSLTAAIQTLLPKATKRK
jgi:hypothetical protein